MAKNKNVEISLEEKLKKALVPVDEQPYTIPSNWVWVYNKALTEIIGDGLHGTPNYDSAGEYYFINGSNLKNLKIEINDETKRVNRIEFEKYKKKLGDSTIFLSINGTLGNIALYKDEKIILGKSVAYLNYNITEIIPFIIFLLKSPYFKIFCEENYTGSTIKNIPLSALRNFLVPLPPLEEQKRIVEKLDFLFEKTKRAKEIIEEVKIDIENRKISILDRAFKGTLTSKWRNENKTSDVKELLKSINEEKIKKWEEDCLQAEKDGNKKPKKPTITEVKDMIVPVDEQPYKLPDSWVWVRLGDLGDYKKGPFGSSLTKSMFVEKGVDTIKVYEQKNAIQKDIKIGNYYITKDYFLEAMTGFEVKPNDIIVSCAGTVGETYIIPNNAEKGIINQALMKITLIEQIHKKYYLEYFDYFLKEESRRQSQGTAIKNIPPFKIFKEFPFPLPPLEEQQEIVRVLDEVLENENKVKELLELEERIDILEKSILHKAFKGELGTQNSSDEPALELLKEIL
jgi:hypothetical protein